MTFSKSSLFLFLCLVNAWALAQENTVEPDNFPDINDIEDIAVADEGAAVEAVEEGFDIQPETGDDIADQQETELESDDTLRVFDLGLEQPAEESPVAEEEITLDRLEARSTYRNYMDSKQYPQAVDVSLHALRLSEAEFGPEDIELIPVLNELGLALLFTKQPEIAIQHFERSIKLIEDNMGIFSGELVDPLTGMGLAMQQMENHSGAINLFLRSQHVIHRDRGVTDLGQTNIMNMLTQSLLVEERLTDAENVQKAILKIHKMNYGADSGRMAKPMMALANWQRRYGLLNNSRYLYRSSIELRLGYLDPDSSAMKPVLEKLGLRYFDLMAPSWMQGYKLSDDVIDALTIHSNSLSAEDRVLSYLAVGDQLVLFGDTKQAHLAYSKAWSLASADVNSEVYRGKYFDAPTILNDGAGLNPKRLESVAADELAYIKMSFTLKSGGQPSGIKIIDSNLDKKQWKMAARNFRSARFRPTIKSGVPLTAEQMTWERVYPRGRQIDPARARNAYAWLMTYASYSHLTR